MKRSISILVSLAMLVQLLVAAVPVFAEDGAEAYTVPESPSVTYNMNLDWKYKRPGTDFPLASAADSVAKNGKQFYDVDYDDSDWDTVSVPHAINALDSFDGLAADAGEGGLYRGFSFYRKHITVPASDTGKKLIMEFEAVRQSVYLYVNGQMAGYYEAGITAMGFDITPYVNYGADNVIAVATDNASDRGQAATWSSPKYGSLTKVTRETKPGEEPGDGSGFGYQWNTKDFNEVQGGITGDVKLYAKNKVYQTLPLYSNMKTTGDYVYATDIDPRAGSATINVKAEIRNESDKDANLTLQVDVVDGEGKVINSFSQDGAVKQASDKDAHFLTVVPEDAYDENPAPTSVDTVDVSYITASAKTEGLNFWSPDSPQLYDVYAVLKDGADVIDVQKITTGFRKVTYDINDGGLKYNDQKVWLTGYAQRATDEWAVIGVANDWLNDIDMQLVKESNANFIRWMHVAPKPAPIRSGDKYGVVSVCPAGDKEGDASGRSWDQRVEVMRDAMIYFRNSPSILFWEAGNNAISAEHMQEMNDLEEKLDPYTDRFSGSRTLSSQDQVKAADYVGTMLNRHAAGAKDSMKAIGKYVPIMETEYAREEAPRRVWDDFSPPDYDYNNKWLGAGASKQDGYDVHDLTSEDLVRVNVGGYNEFYTDRVGGSSGNDYYSAAAALVWSDSNQHTRNSGSENCRTSGRVDPIRIKKQSFYAYQAMQATSPTINIIGHWNYPQLTEDNYWYNVKEKVGTAYTATGERAQRDPKNKTVYVVGSADVAKVELFVNDVSVGVSSKPTNTFLYSFPNVDVTQSGKVSAKAYNLRDEVIAEDEIKTAGDPATVKLTPVTGPDGLVADGSDVAYFDVEVVDADGNVCPLDYEKINLSVSGEGVLLGGYNSGEGESVTGYGRNNVNEIGADFVYAECGVNRVFVRSTRNAGAVSLTASLEGKLPVTSTIQSTAVETEGGLTTEMQRAYKQGEVPVIVVESVDPLKALGKVFTADWDKNVATVEEAVEEKDVYTVKVNGTAVSFAADAYRPDETTGVVAEIAPILDALKAAGANIEYSAPDSVPAYITDGKLPLISITGGLKSGYTRIDAPNGSTTLYINSGADKNLLNAELATDDANVLTADIAAVLGYLEGVESTMSVEDKTLYVTYNGEAVPTGITITPAGDNAVTITSDTAKKAQLIFAAYDGSRLTAVERREIDITIGSANYAPSDSFKAEGVVKAMLWESNSQTPITEASVMAGSAQTSAVLAAYYAPAEAEPVIVEETEEVTEEKAEPEIAEEEQTEEEEQIEEEDFGYAELFAVYGDYDSTLAEEKFDAAPAGATLETEGAPDGSSYIVSGDADIDGLCSIGADSMADMLWEGDIFMNEEGAGFSIRNKANNYGTCIHMNNGQFAIQTGGSSYTRYAAVPVDKWLHVELKGRYSAPDARIDMTVYYYNDDGTRTLVDTYPAVNLRNLSANNKAGAMDITVHAHTSVDNLRATLLGADAINIVDYPESIKGGNTSQITYGATRQGEYITSPAVTWSVYNSDNSAPLEDENVTISATGLLNVGLNAASQTVYVRATAESGVYGSVPVQIEAVDASDVKFDTLTLSTEQKFVNADNPMTITATATKNGSPVELSADDLIWYVTDAADLRKLGDDLKLIKVENGVLTVDSRAVAQNITVRAADPTDVVRGSLPVYIKSSDALEGNDEGNKDVYVMSDACESAITGADLTAGSWDGTSYQAVTADTDMAKIGANTTSDLVIETDIKFNPGSSFIPKRADNGKLSTCLYAHENGGKLYLAEMTGSNRYTDYIEITAGKWYHLTWIGKTKTYSSIILEEYDENGSRVNRKVQKVGRRNDEAIEHVTVSANTAVDNLRVLYPTPTALELSTDVATVLAGNTVQGTAKAYWNEVEIEGLDGSTIKFEIYDADNKYPLDSDKITVDASGLVSVDAMAPAGGFYLRASSTKGTLFDSKLITVLSSDIFEVTGIGINSAKSKITQLTVNKNFDSYKDEVTFVAVVYAADGSVKNANYRMMYADGLAAGENKISVSMDLPTDYNSETDVVKVFTVSKLTGIEGSEDKTISAASSDGSIVLTSLPAAGSDAVIMVLKPGADASSVSASDIAYFTQLSASELGESVTLPAAASGSGYTVKLGTSVDGIHTIFTGETK